jgi:hypothetical protein
MGTIKTATAIVRLIADKIDVRSEIRELKNAASVRLLLPQRGMHWEFAEK